MAGNISGTRSNKYDKIKKMAKLVFDIETTSIPYEEVDLITKKKVEEEAKELASLNGVDYETALQQKKDELGFSPASGEIVALGVYDPDNQKGAVYFQAKDKSYNEEKDGIKFVSMSEKEILLKFWDLIRGVDEIVGFNSRMFDAPYIMIRSAIHGIRPSKDLLSNRYLSSQKFDMRHVDLFDLLSFYGAARYRGSLNLWCHAFGIESPKTGDVDGAAVHQMFRDGRFLEIAEYNARDIVSTAKLYEYWYKYLRF